MREGFQLFLEICIADNGFVGRYEVVEPRPGNGRWPDDVRAWIVAESFKPGVRVLDVARRHGVIPSFPIGDVKCAAAYWCCRYAMYLASLEMKKAA